MSSAIVAFVVQMIAGIVGSVAASAALHEHRLGPRTSTVAGFIGGLAGYLVYAAIPAWSTALGSRSSIRRS